MAVRLEEHPPAQGTSVSGLSAVTAAQLVGKENTCTLTPHTRGSTMCSLAHLSFEAVQTNGQTWGSQPEANIETTIELAS